MLKRILALTVSMAVLTAPLQYSLAVVTPEYGVEALGIVKKLETMAPRLAGTTQETKSAVYIAEQFKSFGLKPSTKAFDYTITDEKTKKKTTFKSANVVATIAGKSTKQVIVGAHYDSVKEGKGADDNASGVAVMLETASRISKSKIKPEYTVTFIAFGAEEVGLHGSKAYVKGMTADQKKNTIVMINLDSLIAGDDMNVYGDLGKKGVYRDLALAYAKENKIPLTTNQGNDPELPKGTTGDWSDHAPFKAAGIQHVYFEGTNWNLGEKDGYTQVALKYGVDGEIWHTKYDTTQYLSKTFPGRIESRLAGFVELVEYLALHVQK